MLGWPAGQVMVQHLMVGRGKKFNIAIFLHAVDVINVKLCVMVLLIELYLFIPLPVPMTVFEGHSIVEQF